MPTWDSEREPYQEFHEAQLRHYGFKQPLPASRKASCSVQAPQLPKLIFQQSEFLGMPVPIAKPKRKVVPTPLAPTPTSAAQPPRPVSPRTQGPEGTRVIFTRPDGRFDPGTIRVEGGRYTPPVSPLLEAESRPGSSSSSYYSNASSEDLTRTDSHTSRNSNTSSRSRKGSTVRRLPETLKEKVGILAMDRNERVTFIRGKHAAAASSHESLRSTSSSPFDSTDSLPLSQGPTTRSASLTLADRIALDLSKRFDSLKGKGRNGSEDSGMSLGMTDRAPEGALVNCVRCYAPIFDFATNGCCQRCYQEAKRATREVQRRGSRWGDETPCNACKNALTLRSTGPSPTSPNPGYMKLPNHKLRRVRQTIYEDPGNPFTPSEERQLSVEHGDDLWKIWQRSGSSPSESSGHHLRNVMTSEEIEASSGQRAEVRRSKLIAVSPLSAPVGSDDDGEQYVAPRTLWRRGSERRLSSQRGQETGDKRDTRFYGFYDEIMSDYRRVSRSNRFF